MSVLFDNRRGLAALTPHMKSLAIALILAGCQPDSHVGATTDGAIAHTSDGAPNTCGGIGDAFVYSGAFSFEAYDFGMVRSTQIVGLAGSALNTDLLSFYTKPLGELETLGDHDIATQNLAVLRWPFAAGTSCDPGNTVCHGFFAQAGTYNVQAVHPRYQVTFTLSSLFERSDTSSPPGAAITGTVTGCIDKANP